MVSAACIKYRPYEQLTSILMRPKPESRVEAERRSVVVRHLDTCGGTYALATFDEEFAEESTPHTLPPMFLANEEIINVGTEATVLHGVTHTQDRMTNCVCATACEPYTAPVRLGHQLE